MTAAQDHPEPVEPPAFLAPDGEVYCLVHGVTGCTAAWCWRCGNHQMDDFGRCADPRCRATCSPTAMAIVEDLRASWGGPVPVEVIAYQLGKLLTFAPPSSLPAESTGRAEGVLSPDASGGRVTR